MGSCQSRKGLDDSMHVQVKKAKKKSIPHANEYVPRNEIPGLQVKTSDPPTEQALSTNGNERTETVGTDVE
eukprot:CAMPEP_0185730052 /NCGR_PEP_ID=MMETSP1171-20130828/8283_1 /TAXON_ID=374046 /ORGANISM="Helicotheca tamensis, Strain CCMP826" /LENGTH=70 /DNA_ID=CAMNT_0028399029 /DNA_START=195 /DNA_END=407 /DNA_ORIENTATION=-